MTERRTTWDDIQTGRTRSRADGILAQHLLNKTLEESPENQTVVQEAAPQLGETTLDAARVEIDFEDDRYVYRGYE